MLKLSPIRYFGCAALVLLPGMLRAQMHKVEKQDKVTRAVGVYEWTGDFLKPTAARLVPVSLFVDSHFEDAGVYLARPVPFTLQNGDEYSVERAGESLGLLELDYARNLVTKHGSSDDDGVGSWYGYGKFVPPAPPKKSNLKASAVKPVLAGGEAPEDDQPHFVVRPGAEETTGPVTTADSKGSSDKTTVTKNPAPDDDPDRPTLRHRDPSTQPASNGKGKREKDSGSVIPVRGSLNDDPDRPTLRRGTPEGELLPKQLEGIPSTLHQVVAVSDATNRDAHVFKREWESKQEHDETLAAMQALAKPMIASYLAANKLQAVAVVPAAQSGPSFASTPKTAAQNSAAKTPAARRAAVKVAAATPPAPAFSLTSEVLESYQLSYGGLPTFIYTTDVPVAAGGPVYLTMVAQRLPAGELQVALSSVTDAQHLNRVPWMRPVDVVDADASHRASLLMELRAQSSRQFALYRLVTAQAEQTFVTGIIQ
jgi:hypothetical protein